MAFDSPVMRRATRLLAVVLLLQLETALADEGNPLRRVITMLQMMKKEVEQEGEKEATLFGRYDCFCKTGKANIEMSISLGEKKVPQLQGELISGQQAVVQMNGDVATATSEREQLKQNMHEAVELRAKELEAFTKESGESKADIEAIGKAVAALRQGVGGSFLQTPGADVLRRLIKTRGVTAENSEVLGVFLSGADASDSGDAQVSNQVIGILEQMKSTMKQVLDEMVEKEEKSVSDSREMKAANEKELKAIQAEIEVKMDRKSKHNVDNVAMAEDLDASSDALEKDKQFYKDTQDKCKGIEDTYREHQGFRSEELVALADTISVLSNDDSLETIAKAATKKEDSAAAVSFLQVRSRASAVDRRKEALKILRATRAARHGRYSAKLDLLELALRGRHAGFDKIIEMIDGMMKVMKEEQAADDKKKEYCRAEFHDTQGSLTESQLKLKDAIKSIEDDSGAVVTLQAEIDEIVSSVAMMDKMVVEAKAARLANNGDFVELVASNRAALQIIEVAEKRLISFYNKQLDDFEPPAEPEEDVASRINVNPNKNGPGAMTVMKGMTGLQEPAYQKQGGGSDMILSMLDKIKLDINRDSHEAEIEETNHKGSFALMTRDAAKKRTIMMETLTMKETTKTSVNIEIEHLKAEKKSSGEELKELKAYLLNLHSECDWLTKNYNMRKEARATEMAALDNGKVVLAGAGGR